MTHRFAFIAVGLGLAWGCGDDAEPPPPQPSAGNSARGGDAGSGTGGSNHGGSSGKGGSAQGGDTSGAGGMGEPGGAGGDDSGGGTGGLGGIAGTGGSAGTMTIPPCPSEMDPGEPPTVTSDCDPEAAFGTTMDLPLPDAAANLLAITPDELTVAWFSSELRGEIYYLADRASLGEAFGAAQELDASTPYVALSPDGLRLVRLSGDGRTLGELTRSARGTAFGTTATETSFATLNADAQSRELTFAGCVFAPDDLTLYYLASDGQNDQPLRVSKRTGGTSPWPVGQAIMGCEFQSHGDAFVQPTGVSADGLTLFFYDFARRQARGAWRETAEGPFVWFKELGMRSSPQPNAACDRLYFTGSSGPSFASLE